MTFVEFYKIQIEKKPDWFPSARYNENNYDQFLQYLIQWGQCPDKPNEDDVLKFERWFKLKGYTFKTNEKYVTNFREYLIPFYRPSFVDFILKNPNFINDSRSFEYKEHFVNHVKEFIRFVIAKECGDNIEASYYYEFIQFNKLKGNQDFKNFSAGVRFYIGKYNYKYKRFYFSYLEENENSSLILAIS